MRSYRVLWAGLLLVWLVFIGWALMASGWTFSAGIIGSMVAGITAVCLFVVDWWWDPETKISRRQRREYRQGRSK